MRFKYDSAYMRFKFPVLTRVYPGSVLWAPSPSAAGDGWSAVYQPSRSWKTMLRVEKANGSPTSSCREQGHRGDGGMRR